MTFDKIDERIYHDKSLLGRYYVVSAYCINICIGAIVFYPLQRRYSCLCTQYKLIGIKPLNMLFTLALDIFEYFPDRNSKPSSEIYFLVHSSAFMSSFDFSEMLYPLTTGSSFSSSSILLDLGESLLLYWLFPTIDIRFWKTVHFRSGFISIIWS